MPPILSDDEKRALLESRLKSFSLDAYGHELNKEVAIDNNDEEAIVEADIAIASILSASLIYENELAALPVPEVNP